MAMPPGGIGDSPDSDRKRLSQRADSFAIGTGTRESKDRDDVESFDDALDSALKPRAVKGAQDDPERQSRELEDFRKDQALDEAERRGSSSPPPNPFLGLLTLPGVGLPNLQVGETQRNEAKERSGGVEKAEKAESPTVSQEVLHRLQEAGLEEPVTNLDDPRLSSTADRLNTEFTLSLSGNERVYVWSQNACHQILTIGLHETKVESAAGTTVETLRRVGSTYEKSTRNRPIPGQEFRPVDS